MKIQRSYSRFCNVESRPSSCYPSRILNQPLFIRRRPDLLYRSDDETIYFCREAKRKNDWQKQWEDEKLKEEEQKKAPSKKKKSRRKSGSDRKDTRSSRTSPKKDQGAKSDLSGELKVKKDRKSKERKAEEKQLEPSVDVVHEPDHEHNQNQEVEKESGFRPSPDFDL